MALLIFFIAIWVQDEVVDAKKTGFRTVSEQIPGLESGAGPERTSPRDDFDFGDLELDKLMMADGWSAINTGWYRFMRKRDASNDSEEYEGDSESRGTNMTEGEREEQIREIEEFVFPKAWMWVLICFHSAVFVVGIVGNTLVCVAVYKNHSMRTVTNYFIVNLAVADFLVILFCLPPSVLWDVTSTWFFGIVMCKVIIYLQVSRWHGAKRRDRKG